MKYVKVGELDHIPEERSWYYDDFGNRLDKETGEFVVLVVKTKENQQPKPEGFIRVDNEWLPKQMEFNF